MEITFGIILVVILCILIWLIVSAMFLLWGARIAGIKNRSWGKAIATIIVGGIAFIILNIALAALPVIGQLFSVIGYAKRRLYISWCKSNPSIDYSDGSERNSKFREGI